MLSVPVPQIESIRIRGQAANTFALNLQEERMLKTISASRRRSMRRSSEPGSVS